ncbi:hypothetical protein FJTKL_11792 [Diaporthe vaccinii]|uniref:Uncharacterized protein n=1 Tax=Diaporthe vaccinii TaxID=105482 RepID=A0ABR4EF97_9PEZI
MSGNRNVDDIPRSPEMCQGYFQPVKARLQMFFNMGIMKRHCRRSFPKDRAQSMTMARVNRTKSKKKAA